jgi:bifunctional ADP-heptose synthase (sugar kinase/adenylyltransferase)
MPTSRRIVQFSSGKSAPPGAKIVYIDGAFDLFHVGHVEILKVSELQTASRQGSLRGFKGGRACRPAQKVLRSARQGRRLP